MTRLTREEVARKIGWKHIIWSAGLVNVVAMLPQLYKILTTRNVEGLSLEMFSIFLAVQIAFALEGFFSRNKMLMVCLGMSAVVNLTIISSVLYLRD